MNFVFSVYHFSVEWFRWNLFSYPCERFCVPIVKSELLDFEHLIESSFLTPKFDQGSRDEFYSKFRFRTASNGAVVTTDSVELSCYKAVWQIRIWKFEHFPFVLQYFR